MAVPSVCGYPDGTNSGVPAGTALVKVPGQVTSGPGWHYDSRGWVSVDTAGTVFQGYDVSANVDVTASNVTIKNVHIHYAGDGFGISLRHTSNVTIEDSTINSDNVTQQMLLPIKDIYGDSTGTQILRNNLYNTSTAIQLGEGLIQDNYIHNLVVYGANHVNGITSNGSTDPLTIRHNTILNPVAQTDAIGLFEDFGTEANRTIDNNLIAGGGYTLYAGQNPGGPATYNIKVTNNRFARIYYPNAGSYGPVTAWNPTGNGNTWTGNIWDDTLTTLTP